MCSKDHLLGFPRVGPDKRHAAIGQAKVSHFDRGGYTPQNHRLTAPVKLIRFAGTKAQRDKGLVQTGAGGR